jgi:hypothetical protein
MDQGYLNVLRADQVGDQIGCEGTISLIAAPGSPCVIYAVCALRFRTPIPWLGDHPSAVNCSAQVRGDGSVTMSSPVRVTPAVRTFRTDANLMRGDHMLRNCSAKRVRPQIRLDGSRKSMVR